MPANAFVQTAGTAPNIQATSNEGGSFVELTGGSVSAFEDPISVDQNPIIQGDFVYGINSQIYATVAGGTGGTVDTNQGRLRLQSGTTANSGNALCKSIKPARYRAGQAMTARFTAGWPSNIAGNYQIVGMGMTDTTISQTNVYAGASGATSATDGYFIGYSGTTFGVIYRNSVTGTWSETVTAQASWNVDVCDGSGSAANPSGFSWSNKANPYPMQIRYPYLGDVKFYVQDPNTGRWVLFHIIKYAGSSAVPQLRNPSLQFWAQTFNVAGVTNETMYVTCMAVFVNGPLIFNGPTYGTSNKKAAVASGTETVVLSLRNATSYNGLTNQSSVRLRSLTFVGDNGTGTVQFNVRVGATVGGTPAFAAILGSTADNGITLTSANSTISTDVAGTTASAGVIKFNAHVPRQAGYVFDLTPFNLTINPGEIWSFTANPAGAATDCAVSVNWQEDV